MISAPVIDPEAIENLRALNPEDDSFLREIVGIFLEDTPARINELRAALNASDQASFIRAAHSIKGSSSNLGAERLRAAAQRLEHDAKLDQWKSLSDRLAEIEAEFAESKRELERLF